MDALEVLIGRLPKSADMIRRRFWRDPVFRAVCEDYRDLLEAMSKLAQPEPPEPGSVAEDQQLADELLAEAVEMLASEHQGNEGGSKEGDR